MLWPLRLPFKGLTYAGYEADLLPDAVQLRELYRLYLQNAEVPAKFSTLLQLREMLAIGAAEAEALEDEILSSGTSFSI